jgi:hypothetical protein
MASLLLLAGEPLKLQQLEVEEELSRLPLVEVGEEPREAGLEWKSLMVPQGLARSFPLPEGVRSKTLLEVVHWWMLLLGVVHWKMLLVMLDLAGPRAQLPLGVCPWVL